MRIATAFAVVLMSASGLLAADPAERLESSPRHHEWVDVETKDGRIVKCWLVFPEVGQKATAVIVIHENRGLTAWDRSITDQVAEAGYLAIAPDMLSGTGPDGGGTDSYESSDAARNGIYQLQQEHVTANLDAAFEYAKQHEAANGKVAVAGFCWGGGQAFAYAGRNNNLAASFVFYGSAPQDDALLKNIQCPVYGFYGGNDFRITGQVPRVRQTMEALGKTYAPVTYDGAGHGFMRAGEAEGASEANRKGHNEAWERWKKLLGEL